MNRPFQETDLLLHEAGAPPIHTQFEELDKFPTRVKKRMYVVHSSKIPEKFDLRKAPTGTAGTLRLDNMENSENERHIARIGVSTYAPPKSQSHGASGRSSMVAGKKSLLPPVSMRPSSNTDSWYMLNLLQAVPFLTSLPYASTMEVLESARVEAFNKNDIVVPAAHRRDVLCVIWEGACVERKMRSTSVRSYSGALPEIEENESENFEKANAVVWHSGDWTAPIVLQPEKRLSGDSDNADENDIVASAREGVKVIILEFDSLHRILKNGSPLYRTYLQRQKPSGVRYEGQMQTNIMSPATEKLLMDSSEQLNVLELIDMNTGLKKLTALQKRHLECLAEGPIAYNPGERLWRAGAPVDKAFLVVAGSATFVVRQQKTFRGSAHPGMLDVSLFRLYLNYKGI